MLVKFTLLQRIGEGQFWVNWAIWVLFVILETCSARNLEFEHQIRIKDICIARFTLHGPGVGLLAGVRGKCYPIIISAITSCSSRRNVYNCAIFGDPDSAIKTVKIPSLCPRFCGIYIYIFSGCCLTLCGVVNSKYVVMIVINNDTVQLFTLFAVYIWDLAEGG